MSAGERTDYNALPSSSMLRTREAAEVLGLAAGTLQNQRSIGGGPPFIKVSSRAVRYRLGDLRAWLTAHTTNETAPGTPASA
jgi:predicted DNA-binding transcriptional regulator AlpA